MSIPIFKSRAEAFDYMLTSLCEKGEDVMEAAKKAEDFAEIVAKNRSLPEIPKNFVGQCMDMLKQVSEVKQQYPDAWEILSGVLGGVVGVIAGTKTTEAEDEQNIEPIDFDNLE